MPVLHVVISNHKFAHHFEDWAATKKQNIRVVDKALLSRTGGIVQGMSGSPILQNGRLVGAVTHVLVNDPTRGYGIFAQTMLEQAEQVATAEK